jgi:hypothetical protein
MFRETSSLWISLAVDELLLALRMTCIDQLIFVDDSAGDRDVSLMLATDKTLRCWWFSCAHVLQLQVIILRLSDDA